MKKLNFQVLVWPEVTNLLRAIEADSCTHKEPTDLKCFFSKYIHLVFYMPLTPAYVISAEILQVPGIS